MPSPLWLAFTAAIVISNFAAWLFARATEAKHKQFAGWILQRFGRARMRAAELKEANP
jgi:hypothetical protein